MWSEKWRMRERREKERVVFFLFLGVVIFCYVTHVFLAINKCFSPFYRSIYTYKNSRLRGRLLYAKSSRKKAPRDAETRERARAFLHKERDLVVVVGFFFLSNLSIFFSSLSLSHGVVVVIVVVVFIVVVVACLLLDEEMTTKMGNMQKNKKKNKMFFFLFL